jgi:hypothetical protein
MNDELRKCVEGSGHGVIKILVHPLPEGTEEICENLSDDS